jgi:hypothetical protein
MALSTAQCIALNVYLEGELLRYVKHYADIYPGTGTVVQGVWKAFIEPYHI